MEPVGVIASLIGISELGFKIAKSLIDTIRAPQQINTLYRELINISSAFNLLASVLKSSDDVVRHEALLTTRALLEDCNITYDEINSHISVAATTEDRPMRTKERIKWPFRKAKVKELQKRLESSKASLNLMVNILNLGAGIAWLKKQNKPSNESLDRARGQFKDSTACVIEVQLAFDEAARSELEANQDAQDLYQSLETPPSKEEWAVSRVGSRQERLIEEMPAFEELSLARLSAPQIDRRLSQESPHELERHQTSPERYEQIKQLAPRIVNKLLICWTYVDGDRLLDGGINLRQSSVRRRTGGFSPSDPGGDEGAAPIVSYDKRTSATMGSSRQTEGYDYPSHEGVAQSQEDPQSPGIGYGSEAVPSTEKVGEDPDLLFFNLPGYHKNTPIYFKSLSIENEKVTIGDVVRQVDLSDWRKKFPSSTDSIQLSYKGTNLEDHMGHLPARIIGIKHRSQIDGTHVVIARAGNENYPPARNTTLPDTSSKPSSSGRPKISRNYTKPFVEDDEEEEVTSPDQKSPSTEFDMTQNLFQEMGMDQKENPASEIPQRSKISLASATSNAYNQHKDWSPDMAAFSEKSYTNVIIPSLYSTGDWRQTLRFFNNISAAPGTEFWTSIETWAGENWQRPRPGVWECDSADTLGGDFDGVAVKFEPGRVEYTVRYRREDNDPRLSLYLGPEVNTTIHVRGQNAIRWGNHSQFETRPDEFVSLFLRKVQEELVNKLAQKEKKISTKTAGMSTIILACYTLCLALLPHSRREKKWLEMVRNGEYYILNGPPTVTAWDAVMKDMPKPEKFRKPRGRLEICFDPGNPKVKVPQSSEAFKGSTYKWLVESMRDFVPEKVPEASLSRTRSRARSRSSAVDPGLIEYGSEPAYYTGPFYGSYSDNAKTSN